MILSGDEFGIPIFGVKFALKKGISRGIMSALYKKSIAIK
jgi:hypothetical protein